MIELDHFDQVLDERGGLEKNDCLLIVQVVKLFNRFNQLVLEELEVPPGTADSIWPLEVGEITLYRLVRH